MNETCHYRGVLTGSADRPVGCAGPVNHIVHDARGCHAYCEAHVKWRLTKSYVAGHSKLCPRRGKPWDQVTKIERT